MIELPFSRFGTVSYYGTADWNETYGPKCPNGLRISRRERVVSLPKSPGSRARSGRLHAVLGRIELKMETMHGMPLLQP